ncbi:preprotein translocase subunit SecG [Ancylobacter sp. A5.8]|uniref:preprotein translocase subunit SecG n=1 Tax=Ancylobacter gelatini TaxID=2919920 RepID=UPI001F4EB4CD|nr:preprotein translocase subunit SecG [Ancylobacter gelatini]MCJ8143095.1 preprotein translocase subunit SecG [Ancylobacter gelatini]
MQTVLIVVHLMVVLALIGVVLIQRSEGGGLGIGGGGGGGAGGGFFSARGTANALTRATAILAGLFFLTSLSLTMVAGWGRGPATIFNTPTTLPSGAPAPAPGGTVLDQLQGAQPAPAAPSGPQVPQSQ